MDRDIVYPAAIPQDSDLLTPQRNAMVGLGAALQDILGTNTVAAGLPCTQTVVASLAVLIGAGRIYSLQNIDNSVYGSLAADTTDTIIKQGIQFGSVTIPTAAPPTSGQSINYLIEAQFQEVDTTPVVLPYYNSSNPQVPFSGPGNTGAPQNTQRKGTVVVQAKAGTAATTGTQTTPAPDSGFVGLYVVTVANGASSVTAANISTLSTAPFIQAVLGGAAPGVNSGGSAAVWSWNASSGPTDAKIWQMFAQTVAGVSSFVFAAVPDTGIPSGKAVLSFVRTGAAIASLVFGNSTDSPGYSFRGAGLLTFPDITPATTATAGGASALPATPAGYMSVSVAGTTRKIPFYSV